MQIEMRLFATFRDRLPSGSGPFSCQLDVEPGTPLRTVLERFQIGDDTPKILLVNGRHAKMDDTLSDQDVVSVFPPVAGG